MALEIAVDQFHVRLLHTAARPPERTRPGDAAYDLRCAEGFSLWPRERATVGTGVAVALAAEHPVARVVLESPYTSIADLAASIYWFVPVRLLLKDSFHSDQRIAKVTAPVLVVHGERDNIVPVTFGQRLYQLIPGPKQLLRLPNAGHNDHDSHGLPEMVKPFVLGR